MISQNELPLMQLENLSFELSTSVTFCLSSQTFKKGSGYLITGEDDEIKTMFLKAIGGLVDPDKVGGKILFNGINLYEATGQELQRIRKRMAYIFYEGTLISNLSIRENLLLPIQFHSPRIDLTPFLKKIEDGFQYWNLPSVLDYRPSELSHSTRKILTFIRAALIEPEIVLLDKPLFNLAGKDRIRVHPFLEQLKKNGTSLIMTSHFDAQLEPLIDEIINLDQFCTMASNGSQESK